MYKERPLQSPSAALHHAGRCAWWSVATDLGPARVVPDACMDVIWNGQLFMAGPDTRPQLYNRVLGTMTVGVRLSPGHGARLLGLPANAALNERVELTRCWGDAARRLQEQLERASSTQAALSVLERAVAVRLATAPEPDPLASAIVAEFERRFELEQNVEPLPTASMLSQRFGLSERQLLRRCTASFGYGPKFLARVLRFQRALRAIEHNHTQALCDVALIVGYGDQAHMTHEVAELAGMTPGSLRTAATQRVSDFDKT